MLMRRFTDDQKRGLRHWAMEFVVVVAGVLLALWLQEWGQRRRAISDMRAAEGAIHDEVRTALESIMWRQAIARSSHASPSSSNRKRSRFSNG